MLGAVLCGGKSTRMGSDKALLQLGSKTWAEIAAYKLQQLHIPTCLSVNNAQATVLRSAVTDVALVEDAIELDVKGPLLGLLSVHATYPSKDILLLACDMPYMCVDVLQHLKATFENTTTEAIVFVNGEQLEPLCAIYSAKALQLLMAKYQQQSLVKYSMHYVLQQLEVTTIQVPLQWQNYFTNVNALSDLTNL